VFSKIKRKTIRTIKRWFRNKNFVLSLSAILLIMSAVIYSNYIENKRLTVDPATYVPLLQLIASAESNDNYNAYFGNASNASVDFTKMTIAQVMKWQEAHVQQGNPSNAVGKYQIISTTLSGLIQRLGIDTNQKFDPSMQDNLAMRLIERRGAEEYVNNKLTRDQFAANLAKEWAGLPKVIGENPSDSYYASDGLNKSRVKVGEVLKAIEYVRPKR
jgi:muramidase (phage lysozyme)